MLQKLLKSGGVLLMLIALIYTTSLYIQLLKPICFGPKTQNHSGIAVHKP